MEKKKILMLTMSCNDPYFQSLLGAVKDTWARPLIQNKYPDITWFAYTACDKHHPNPCVDFENNMIYVDCPDDLEHTYIKTQKAYHLIKDKVDFNYVIRTNTSVFVNIERMLKHVERINYLDVIANFTKIDNVCGDNFWLIIGFFFGMCREMFEIGMSYNNELDNLPFNDDIIMSKKIYNFTKDNYNGIAINDDNSIPIYKPCFDEDKHRFCEFTDGHNFKYPENPDVINDYVCVRFRTFYNGQERKEKGYEIQHIYELNNALKR